MKTFLKFLFIPAALLALTRPGTAKELPRLDAFTQDVERLVRRFYPEADMAVTGTSLNFSHETMEFMIHLPLKTGEWQDARPMPGPKRHGGIRGELALREGRWAGAAMVPQSFDRFYFTSSLRAPYSERCGCHLEAHLDFPDTVDPQFVKAWAELIDSFEKYLKYE